MAKLSGIVLTVDFYQLNIKSFKGETLVIIIVGTIIINVQIKIVPVFKINKFNKERSIGT